MTVSQLFELGFSGRGACALNPWAISPVPYFTSCIFVSLYVRMCLCVLTCMWVHMHMGVRVCKDQRSALATVPQESDILCFESGSLSLRPTTLQSSEAGRPASSRDLPVSGLSSLG